MTIHLFPGGSWQCELIAESGSQIRQVSLHPVRKRSYHFPSGSSRSLAWEDQTPKLHVETNGGLWALGFDGAFGACFFCYLDILVTPESNQNFPWIALENFPCSCELTSFHSLILSFLQAPLLLDAVSRPISQFCKKKEPKKPPKRGNFVLSPNFNSIAHWLGILLSFLLSCNR